jgi:hypothetical protein
MIRSTLVIARFLVWCSFSTWTAARLGGKFQRPSLAPPVVHLAQTVAAVGALAAWVGAAPDVAVPVTGTVAFATEVGEVGGTVVLRVAVDVVPVGGLAPTVNARPERPEALGACSALAAAHYRLT